MSEKKTCFIIAPIGEPDSDVRKRSDQMLKHVFMPAASECGYEAIRADQISEPGIITSQVIQHVVDDPMVIADLTGRNPNVFYELALRHALKKPLVQVIKKGEHIPFDVAATRTIPVDIHDLDSVDEATQEIVRQIRSFDRGAIEVDTPISVALDLQELRRSAKPEERSLADVLEQLSAIRKVLVSVDERVRQQAGLSTFTYEPGHYFSGDPKHSIVITAEEAARLFKDAPQGLHILGEHDAPKKAGPQPEGGSPKD